MAKVIPPPSPEPFELLVVLDGVEYYVQAHANETVADVRAAILRDLGRTEHEAASADWPIRTARGIQALGPTPIAKCREWMGFKFFMARPGSPFPPEVLDVEI